MRTVAFAALLFGSDDAGALKFLQHKVLNSTGNSTGNNSKEGRFNEKLYGKDWHNEWEHGDFPHWKETHEKEDVPHLEKYEDRQSDGKPSKARLQLLANGSTNKSGNGSGDARFDEKSYAEDWHTEWKRGDFPHWKETHEKEDVPHLEKYEDRQSDGKPSKARLQLLANESTNKSGNGSGDARFDEKLYGKDWHNEWEHGDFPHWKETHEKEDVPHLEKYEDRQSDGKPSKAGNLKLLSHPPPMGSGILPSDPMIASAGVRSKNKYNYSGYGGDWHAEWEHGDFPGWKATHKPEDVFRMMKYQDSQSDGKTSASKLE